MSYFFPFWSLIHHYRSQGSNLNTNPLKIYLNDSSIQMDVLPTNIEYSPPGTPTLCPYVYPKSNGLANYSYYSTDNHITYPKLISISLSTNIDSAPSGVIKGTFEQSNYSLMVIFPVDSTIYRHDLYSPFCCCFYEFFFENQMN